MQMQLSFRKLADKGIRGLGSCGTHEVIVVCGLQICESGRPSCFTIPCFRAWRVMFTKAVCHVAVLAIMISTSFLSFAASAPQVKTHSGTVEGKDDGKVHAFLGIPYAAPPVGDLRWKEPQPVAKWNG